MVPPRRQELVLPTVARMLREFIADGPVAQGTPPRHSGQNRNVGVDVIVYDHARLRRLRPIQSAGVLRQRALPGNRHGKEQRVERGVIKPLRYPGPHRFGERAGMIRRLTRPGQLLAH